MQEVIDRQTGAPNAVFFLGDGLHDLDTLESGRSELYCVRGNCDVFSPLEDEEQTVVFDGKKIFMMLVLLILTFMAGIMVGNCTSRPYMTSYPYGPHLVKQYEHMKHKKFHKGMHEVAPNTAQQNTPDMPNQAVEGYIVEINQTN